MSQQETELIEASPTGADQAPEAGSMGKWYFKLMVCIAVDAFDMTVGRVLVFIPFSGELIGCAVACSLFGKSGLFMGLEGIDFTEQIDGFIPTATIIALANKPR